MEGEELLCGKKSGYGIATYDPHVSFVRQGQEQTITGRQTLVFLETAGGWKIVHEHGTIPE